MKSNSFCSKVGTALLVIAIIILTPFLLGVLIELMLTTAFLRYFVLGILGLLLVITVMFLAGIIIVTEERRLRCKFLKQ